MNTDRTVFAAFFMPKPSTPSTATLTTVIAGSGTGTVSGVPGGACNPTCGLVSVGQPVVLTATAAGDSIFKSWDGCDAENQGTCIIVTDSDRTITATFMARFLLDIGADAGGKVTSTDTDPAINCPPRCIVRVESTSPPSNVVLTAERVNSSVTFDGWTGDRCVNAGEVCSVVMDANIKVRAKFVDNSTKNFTLTLTALGAGGTVQARKKVLGVPADIVLTCRPANFQCAKNLAGNTEVVIEAIPDNPAPPSLGSHTDAWQGDCEGLSAAQPVCERTMTRSISVGVQFRSN